MFTMESHNFPCLPYKPYSGMLTPSLLKNFGDTFLCPLSDL